MQESADVITGGSRGEKRGGQTEDGIGDGWRHRSRKESGARGDMHSAPVVEVGGRYVRRSSSQDIVVGGSGNRNSLDTDCRLMSLEQEIQGAKEGDDVEESAQHVEAARMGQRGELPAFFATSAPHVGSLQELEEPMLEHVD